MSQNPIPFSSLDPVRILNALESIGLRCDGRLLALNSYENRVYQIGIEDDLPLVAKFYRPQRWKDDAILEEHAFLHELNTAEIPAVAALPFAGHTLHHSEGFRFAVFPKLGGRAPELDQEGVLSWLGRFIGRIHAVGSVKDYAFRPAINIDTYGIDTSNYLLDNGFIPEDLLEAYRSCISLALDGVKRCYERAGDLTVLRLHGDCHIGNILWTDQGPHFVDFDDSVMGPALQDLWMLLSGTREEMSKQLGQLLTGYRYFNDFNHAELHLVEALRTLRLIHYSAWLAKRWADPAFPHAFPWFNTQRYWQDIILGLREQIALMDEAPLFPDYQTYSPSYFS